MDESSVLNDVAKTFIDDQESFTLNIKPKNWLHKILIRIKLSPSQVKLTIDPPSLGTMIAFAKELLSLGSVNADNEIQFHLKTVLTKAEKAAHVIAIILCNRPVKSTHKLVKLLLDNMDAKEFKILFYKVIAFMNMGDFTNTITLIEKVNILKEVSPTEETEIIAAQTETPSQSPDLPLNIFAGANITSYGE